MKTVSLSKFYIHLIIYSPAAALSQHNYFAQEMLHVNNSMSAWFNISIYNKLTVPVAATYFKSGLYTRKLALFLCAIRQVLVYWIDF